MIQIRKSIGRSRGFVNRVLATPAALIIPALDLFLPRHHNVLIVRQGPRGKYLFGAHNIVTNAGDVYYAQSAAGETPTNAFGTLYLSSVNFSAINKTTDAGDVASVISGGSSTPESGYPKTNDDDTDNTGAGTDILSWEYDFAAGDFNDADIEDGCIAVAGTTFGSGSDPLLNAFSMTQFAKTASDTLKVFVNHEFTGV